MPVFRSRAQGALLADLLLHPTEEFSLTDLAQRTGTALSTVHDEVERLVAAGILAERYVGRSRLVRASASNPAVRPLTDLAAMTFGPLAAVRDAFTSLTGAERVLIYGSWAARYHGEPGPPPHDLDVLVVGPAKRAAVYDAADEVERRTGFTVNPVLMSAARWTKRADPLVRQIRASATVEVVG
jgi:hypothetical protein